ncbi:MAG TPA: zinc-dependent peptidase [Aquaticitalea sp.]|nr:zinc-dependent peptidase [Aquaticitalea sp.]
MIAIAIFKAGELEGANLIIWAFVAILFCVIVYYAVRMVEMGYILRHKRPFYVYNPFFLTKLSDSQRQILKKRFVFYRKLSDKHKAYFEDRVNSFIKDKDFIGRGGLEITEEMKIMVAATAVMLTFGFRDFYIGLIQKIFLYPEAFFSKTNEHYHKGEFNPKLQAMVLSWKDFMEGFEDNSDGVNLGIHEFAHAIHLNSIKERDVSSTIFSDSVKELTDLLAHEESLRKSLIDSEYFRNYAYTNQYEFVAVIIETFIETPKEFKARFPIIYDKTKQMLNFNFAGY